MTAKFKVKHIADSHIDNAKKALVPPLELALVKYLNRYHRGVLDSTTECSANITNSLSLKDSLTYQNSRSSMGLASS